MRYYEHSGTNSIVYVDDSGKKKIAKYGQRFNSFIELKQFEYMIEINRRKNAEVKDLDMLLDRMDTPSEKDLKYLRNEYRNAKGE